MNLRRGGDEQHQPLVSVDVTVDEAEALSIGCGPTVLAQKLDVFHHLGTTVLAIGFKRNDAVPETLWHLVIQKLAAFMCHEILVRVIRLGSIDVRQTNADIYRRIGRRIEKMKRHLAGNRSE